MIIHADGHPGSRRYSVGLVGSILIHFVLVTTVLWVAGTMQPADPVGAGGGAGRYAPRHSSALLRGGQFGGEPTGMTDALPQPVQTTAWPVRQAERLKLRLAIGSVIDHLWQSTLFAVVVGLLTLAFRRNRARVRYALWFAASVKFLLPFSQIVWFGSLIGSSVFARSGVSDPLGPAGSSHALTGAAWAFLQDLVQHPLIGGIGQWLAATGGVALWPSTFTMTEVTAAWLALALVGIWACGFVAIVASRIRLSRQIWDVVLTSRRVELIDVKVPARLQVGLADGLLEPGVIGWLHPVLLLPADIEDHLTRPEIEAIVAHELCHVRRFDNMTAAIHMLVEAIFWFHPLVWWLGARLVDERERACDEHVLRSVGAPGPYAQGILNVCKRYVGSPLASISGVGSANVRQRIDAILANRIGEATGPWKKMLLSGISLCVVVVPLAAGALQPPPQRATPSPNTSSVGVSVVTGYALVVARTDGQLGPELRRAGAVGSDAGAAGARPGHVAVRPGQIAADAITLPRLAAVLAGEVGSDVEDRTGLTGNFTVRLTWTSDPSGPSLFAAVQQQLGLRLVPFRADSR
jgi:beta-lactamase regulating signal transducer with metallopeptidase domain